MISSKSSKSSKQFICETCNFKCCNKNIIIDIYSLDDNKMVIKKPKNNHEK